MLFVQGNKKKHRAKIVEYYVEVATECYDKGNFNSAMAIIGKTRFGVYFAFTITEWFETMVEQKGNEETNQG